MQAMKTSSNLYISVSSSLRCLSRSIIGDSVSNVFVSGNRDSSKENVSCSLDQINQELSVTLYGVLHAMQSIDSHNESRSKRKLSNVVCVLSSL